jgi:PKD repeat protein
MGKRLWRLLLVGGLALLLGGCLQPATNTQPTASFVFEPLHGYRYAPLEVLFDASGSTDLDGRIIDYKWDFGDGTSGSGIQVVHTYSYPGEYQIELVVYDNRGGSERMTETITVPAVPDGEFLCRYEWTYKGVPQALEVLLPQHLYHVYHDQERPPLVGTYNYGDYVSAPLDDPTLKKDVALELRKMVSGDDTVFAQYALSFVQGAIDYTQDLPGFEYPLYPLETLVDRVGDCEDTTILYVSLLRALHIPSSIAFVDTDHDGMPDHVLALVSIASADVIGSDCPVGMKKGVYDIAGGLYAIAETAVDPAHSGYIPLGCDPWGIGVEDIKQRWEF